MGAKHYGFVPLSRGGLEYSPSRAFSDILLLLNLTDSDTYNLYKGDNCSVVANDYPADNSMFGLLKGVNLWKSHYLNLFNDTVVAVVTKLPHSVQAKVLNVNYIRLGAFVAGILLFIFARSLAKNTLSMELICSKEIDRFTNPCWWMVTSDVHVASYLEKFRIARSTVLKILCCICCYGHWAMQAVALLLISASSESRSLGPRSFSGSHHSPGPASVHKILARFISARHWCSCWVLLEEAVSTKATSTDKRRI
ncbi:unnamed protein product [Cylicocyclus nassatus]|uniref:Uncharacterized protein n=1 Tax=Cylicocyclus nassatus TaxID=53992 RepID=A0AA36GGM4_CYLNA|nr:unnamed protein product [Cylicocyclus nassatus]